MLASITTSAQRWAVSQVMTHGLKDRLELLAERQALYARVTDPALIARHQLDAVNETWARARRRYRFYADWQRRHRLPDRLDDLEQLADFPLLRSTDIEESFDRIAADAQPCELVRTGGSTGRPRYFPRGAEDHPLHHATMYLARGWAGIRPGDEIALIWSHTHLFGHGLKGRVNVARRHVKDWLIGTRRFSAYSLDDDSIASYFRAMKARPGTVVVGYASCIRKLLDYVESAGVDGPAAAIRAVVFCSETVFPKDLERVRRLLAAEPLVEYGMQETGVMGYSRPGDSNVTFLWDAFHGRMGAGQELVITTLLPVRFPLINFATGDRVEPLDDGKGPPFRCARILGRTRDILTLTMRDGRAVDAHSDFIFDILQIDDGVRSFFIHQKDRHIDIAVVAASPAELARIERRFLHEIQREFPAIDTSAISFSFLEQEPHTVAGKRLYVLRE